MKFFNCSMVCLLLCVCFFSTIHAQNYVSRTFKDTRVINSHSVETLAKGKLDVRIGHRFGDFAGEAGGFQTFFGLETASDVIIGAEYGFTDNFTAGLYRSKGAGSLPTGGAGLRQNLNGVFKYRIIRQTTDGVPFTLGVVLVSTLSTAEKIEDNPDIIRNFPKFTHRMANSFQFLAARKFSESFSIQVIPAYTHRNLVTFNDENGIFSLGIASRIQLTKVLGLIIDTTFPISEQRLDDGFYPAIGLGLEIETGGHIFQVNFTNATGMMETDYIPYTTSNWFDGEFRLGFTISRTFNL